MTSPAGTAATTGGAATTGTVGPGHRAAAGPLLLGVRHHGPGSARAVLAALAAARPAAVLIEGPPEGDALMPLAADPRMRPPSRCSRTPWTTRGGPPSGRWPRSRPSGWPSAGPSTTTSRSASSICPPPTPSRSRNPSRARGARRRRGRGPGKRSRRSSTRSGCSPRPPDTTIPNAGGRTSSSTVHRAERVAGATRATRSRRSSRWRRPWRLSAKRTATADSPGTRCARRTCGSNCAPHAKSSGTTSPSSAAPGMSPPSPRGPPSPPTAPCSRDSRRSGPT